MKIFNPYKDCAGCGKNEIAEGIESTSGYYGQCEKCLKMYKGTGFIQANYLIDQLNQKIMICEAQINNINRN